MSDEESEKGRRDDVRVEVKNGGRKQRGEGMRKASEKGGVRRNDISVGMRGGTEGEGKWK